MFYILETSRLSNNCQDKDFTENHDNGVTIQPVKVNITNQISKLFRILSPRQRLLLGTSASVHMCSTFLRYAIGDWIAIMLLNNKHGYSQSTGLCIFVIFCRPIHQLCYVGKINFLILCKYSSKLGRIV